MGERIATIYDDDLQRDARPLLWFHLATRLREQGIDCTVRNTSGRMIDANPDNYSLEIAPPFEVTYFAPDGVWTIRQSEAKP
jgi:hypothetical protein